MGVNRASDPRDHPFPRGTRIVIGLSNSQHLLQPHTHTLPMGLGPQPRRGPPVEPHQPWMAQLHCVPECVRCSNYLPHWRGWPRRRPAARPGWTLALGSAQGTCSGGGCLLQPQAPSSPTVQLSGPGAHTVGVFGCPGPPHLLDFRETEPLGLCACVPSPRLIPSPRASSAHPTLPPLQSSADLCPK